MRWLVLARVLAATPAHADGARFAMVGLGSSLAIDEPGWAFRAEQRLDATRIDDDEASGLVGARFGLEAWEAGSHWGFAMPLGVYAGAQVSRVRTTLGGGVGLWTFEKQDSKLHYGVSPFASASLEGSVGKLALSLDASSRARSSARPPTSTCTA